MTTTHTAGRWTECPVCMAKDRMLDASAENYRRRIVDHAHCSPLEREREDVAYARYRLAFHEWERSVADHRAANGEETEAPAAEPAETEEMDAVCEPGTVDELVNVYGGHIDQWLKALRERSFAQTAEPMPRDRDAYERLWYGDVPEITLPPSFAGLDAMTLTHCARAIGFYLRVLKQYAPVSDDASHVAHRLMDAFDDAAEARETALAGGEGEEK